MKNEAGFNGNEVKEPWKNWRPQQSWNTMIKWSNFNLKPNLFSTSRSLLYPLLSGFFFLLSIDWGLIICLFNLVFRVMMERKLWFWILQSSIHKAVVSLLTLVLFVLLIPTSDFVCKMFDQRMELWVFYLSKGYNFLFPFSFF